MTHKEIDLRNSRQLLFTERKSLVGPIISW